MTAEEYAAQVLNRDPEEGSQPFRKVFTRSIEALPEEVFEHLPCQPVITSDRPREMRDLLTTSFY